MGVPGKRFAEHLRHDQGQADEKRRHRDDDCDPGSLLPEVRGHARLRSSCFPSSGLLGLEDAACPAEESTGSFMSGGFRVAGREVGVELEQDAERVAGVPDLGDLAVLDAIHRHSAVHDRPTGWRQHHESAG